MSNISWMYKNKCESPYAIYDISGTSNTDYGTSELCDFNLQTEFRTKNINTAASITFDFGSVVSVDSLIVIHNLNETGTLYIKAGDTNPPTTVTYGLPILGYTGTSMNYLDSAVDYRYWNIYGDGNNFTEITKIKEIFIGKRNELSVNPAYSF